jgi:hypothetical protein
MSIMFYLEHDFLEFTYDVLENVYCLGCYSTCQYAVLQHFFAVLEQGGVTKWDYIMQDFLFPE